MPDLERDKPPVFTQINKALSVVGLPVSDPAEAYIKEFQVLGEMRQVELANPRNLDQIYDEVPAIDMFSKGLYDILSHAGASQTELSEPFRQWQDGRMADFLYYQWQTVEATVLAADPARQEAFAILMAAARPGFEQFKGSLLDPVRALGWTLAHGIDPWDRNPYKRIAQLHSSFPNDIAIDRLTRDDGSSADLLHFHFAVDLKAQKVVAPAEVCIKAGQTGVLDRRISSYFRPGEFCADAVPLVQPVPRRSNFLDLKNYVPDRSTNAGGL